MLVATRTKRERARGCGCHGDQRGAGGSAGQPSVCFLLCPGSVLRQQPRHESPQTPTLLRSPANVMSDCGRDILHKNGVAMWQCQRPENVHEERYGSGYCKTARIVGSPLVSFAASETTPENGGVPLTFSLKFR
ncbi:uncharacterized protein LOC119577564 [Penaeus monodon]|uniref:uncharacterized protein LOC119577564 n=1 Tax=Penaeus monodon TaxID=6687 RepID=UPI0018A75DD0|nr:uncharacterized protein LOC119577564 [Penaeus monodon]